MLRVYEGEERLRGVSDEGAEGKGEEIGQLRGTYSRFARVYIIRSHTIHIQ